MEGLSVNRCLLGSAALKGDRKRPSTPALRAECTAAPGLERDTAANLVFLQEQTEHFKQDHTHRLTGRQRVAEYLLTSGGGERERQDGIPGQRLELYPSVLLSICRLPGPPAGADVYAFVDLSLEMWGGEPGGSGLCWYLSREVH
ncbi:hypothetical protein PAMP_006084 [Pampus punctatissimus]